MKIKEFMAILLFLFFLGGQFLAQTKVSTKSAVDLPFHLNLEKEIKSRFKEYFDEQTQWSHLITDRFYPVGWSKTGKFAYLIEPAQEDAMGGYRATFVIQDLTTDKILWNHRYHGPENKNETLATFWRAKRALFTKKLKESGIEPNQKFSLLTFPVKYEGDELIPHLEIKRFEKSEDDYPHNISQILVKMNSKQKGEKSLFKKAFNQRVAYAGAMDAHVFGYLMSPFEPRAVLIMIEVQRGWEGPPHITATRVIGASLVNGFKK